MRRDGILNVQLGAAIAQMGHDDIMSVTDAGFPIRYPDDRVIDLAVVPGVPDLFTVLSKLNPRIMPSGPLSLAKCRIQYYTLTPLRKCREYAAPILLCPPAGLTPFGNVKIDLLDYVDELIAFADFTQLNIYHFI